MRLNFNFTASSVSNVRTNHPHVYARQHALMLYEPNAIYSLIPKNACSTMRYTLAIENGFIDGPSQINWIHQNNDTFAASDREAVQASFAFVILRCPFRRLYSAFMDKFVNMDIQSWELRNASLYRVHPHDITFSGFVEWIRNPGLLNLNHHWKPQSAFLLFKEYDAYYSLEEFGACAADLRERIGITVRDARGLTGHSIDSLDKVDEGADYANMSAFDLLRLKREGKVPSERALFTNELVAAVSGIYRQDIELYRSRIGAANLLFQPVA